MCEGMTFEEALSKMKEGKALTYHCVKGQLMYKIQFPEEMSKMTSPYVYAVFPDGGRCPISFPNSAYFANTWEVVNA